MTPDLELQSFVTKFRYLTSAGYPTSLSFTSDENRHARVSLEVNLGFIQPPFDFPPPSPPASKNIRRSPGYYRRLQRRKESRQQFNSTNDDVETQCLRKNEIETEKVSESITGNEDLNASACDNIDPKVLVVDSDCTDETKTNSFEDTEEVANTESVRNNEYVMEYNGQIGMAVIGVDDRKSSLNESESRPPCNASAADSIEDDLDVAKYDRNISAIDNLKNLTLSLDLIHRRRNFNSLH